MKNIHAFTETRTTPPGYISINDEAGRLTVSVRTRGGQVPSVIEMNRDQMDAMHADVGAYLAATAPMSQELAAITGTRKESHKPIIKTVDMVK